MVRAAIVTLLFMATVSLVAAGTAITMVGSGRELTLPEALWCAGGWIVALSHALYHQALNRLDGSSK